MLVLGLLLVTDLDLRVAEEREGRLPWLALVLAEHQLPALLLRADLTGGATHGKLVIR